MSLNTGAPHFKSVAKQHRHANYTLEKVLNEGVDNVIKKATEIHITTDVDDSNRLQEIKISDDYLNGFESINEVGIQNPFNMGHIKVGHDDDDETSEFGVGLKAGALSAANQLSVISQVAGAYHEVICDFIKMEREEDVNASYNPKIREITEADYNQVHPFQIGSSIVMSKIRETICERMTQHDLTIRIKKGISGTYSRFLMPNRRIFVNGEQVEKEIDLFTDPNCDPFTINKCLFVLEKHMDKIILARKTIERATWQIYDKRTDKWEVFKHSGEDYMTDKIAEGYVHSYPKRAHVTDMSCIDIDSTFAFYSDLFHSGGAEPEKPFDNVLIYKDDRKYGKKSLVKHNDGNNNFTLHKIEFSSKKIGKELGITFNKEITLDGSNELILAIKSAIADSRKEFNANTSTTLNNKLCEKAVKRGIINWKTCNIEKLSNGYRELRAKYTPLVPNPNPPVVPNPPVDPNPVPVDPNPIPVDPNPILVDPNPVPVDPNPILVDPNPILVDPNPILVDPNPVPVDPNPIPVDPNPVPVDPNPVPVDPNPVPVDPNPIPVDPNPIPVDPNPVPVDPNPNPPVDPNPIPVDPRQLLIEASKLLMVKASGEDCDIQLEDSIRILELVKSVLKI